MFELPKDKLRQTNIMLIKKKKKKADRHYSPSQPQLNEYVQNLLKNIRYILSIFGQSSWKH